jgi:carbamoyltransferase
MDTAHIDLVLEEAGGGRCFCITTFSIIPCRRQKRDPRLSVRTPYLGGAFEGAAVQAALDGQRDQIDVTQPNDWALAAAKDIAEDQIVAWFEGRREIGPRALGHRSLLANPGRQENWTRVNAIKTREKWRPFAPAVLEDKATRWFQGAPAHSPHMLYTAQVTTPDFPAITHVDGSSRLQTVSPDVGDFYRMLQHLKTLTGYGVVLTTSFNGPGEPIMKRPEEALHFLLTTAWTRFTWTVAGSPARERPDKEILREGRIRFYEIQPTVPIVHKRVPLRCDGDHRTDFF